MATDPYTQILDALWAALEARTALAAMVPIRNRAHDRGRQDFNAAQDFPRLTLEPAAGGGVGLRTTSTSSRFTQVMQIGVETADENPRSNLLPIKWQIVGALADATKGDRPFGLAFAVKLAVTDATPLSPYEQQFRPGWAAVLNVAVDFSWPTANLLQA